MFMSGFSAADFGIITALFFHPINATSAAGRSIQDLCEWGCFVIANVGRVLVNSS